jgi:hypothetical protein
MEAGAIVPRAYILSRDAQPGLVQTALAAFSITPLSCVIISNPMDYALAHEFGGLVLKMCDEFESIDFALSSFEETQMPSLIIGSRAGITAIYGDGRVEDLPWQAVDSMPN